MKPSELAIVLPKLISQRRPVFIHGSAGAGKSSVIQQVVAAMKRQLNDVRLSQLDSIDIRGFPVPNMKTGTMDWLPASFLPKPDAKPGVLFLDEMNSAMPAVMSPAYQLILDHRIGDYILPDNWSIVAAGNGQSDRGITHQMPAPLNNRFIHIDYEVDNDDWQHQAMKDGVHVHIRAYLKLKSQALHQFDPTQNPRCFPTPRSWYFADQLYKDNYTPDQFFELLKGTVGEGAAAEFVGFVRDVANMPDITLIQKDPENAPLPGSQAVMHAVVTTLGDLVKTKPADFEKLMKYVERLQREIQVVFVRTAMRHASSITSTKAFQKWGLANSNILT